MFLQPGAGDFQQYAELTNPYPTVSPSWANQYINPNYDPAFNVLLRYMPTASDDFALDWTHLRATDNASVTASSAGCGVMAPSCQFVGPPYSIGPGAGAFFLGGTANGSLQWQYDAVNLTVRHNFCVDCPFEFSVFGGVEYARLSEILTGTFTGTLGPAAPFSYHQYVSNSLFNGAGLRLGMRGQYNLGQFQFFGEGGGAALIGTSQNNMNFTTMGPLLLTTNYQTLTSPNVTQVVPAVDAKLGTSYKFPIGADDFFKLEVGYQAAVYFDAVNQYALSMVTGSNIATGVYLETDYQKKSNLTVQGPYMQGTLLF